MRFVNLLHVPSQNLGPSPHAKLRHKKTLCLEVVFPEGERLEHRPRFQWHKRST